MTLSRDYIVKASLLKHTGEECGASPILEEEAFLLGEKPKATSILEHPEISEPPDPSEQIDAQPAKSTE